MDLVAPTSEIQDIPKQLAILKGRVFTKLFLRIDASENGTSSVLA